MQTFCNLCMRHTVSSIYSYIDGAISVLLELTPYCIFDYTICLHQLWNYWGFKYLTSWDIIFPSFSPTFLFPYVASVEKSSLQYVSICVHFNMSLCENLPVSFFLCVFFLHYSTCITCIYTKYVQNVYQQFNLHVFFFSPHIDAHIRLFLGLFSLAAGTEASLLSLWQQCVECPFLYHHDCMLLCTKLGL